MSLLKVNTIRNRNGTGSPAFDFGVNISGISTVSGVKISSGIITSELKTKVYVCSSNLKFFDTRHTMNTIL